MAWYGRDYGQGGWNRYGSDYGRRGFQGGGYQGSGYQGGGYQGGGYQGGGGFWGGYQGTGYGRDYFARPQGYDTDWGRAGFRGGYGRDFGDQVREGWNDLKRGVRRAFGGGGYDRGYTGGGYTGGRFYTNRYDRGWW